MVQSPSHSKAINVFGALALAVGDMLEKRAQQNFGFSANVPAALIQIATEPGLTIDALSKLLGLSHSATVRLVDRLCAREFVVRARGQDLREVLLHLTQSGEFATRRILAERAALLEQAFQDFSEEDWLVFEPLMIKIFQRVLRSKLSVDMACRLCDQLICPHDICPAEPSPK